MSELDDALRYARQSTVGPDEWLRRIRDGYKGAPYRFEQTAWFRALKALEREARSSAPGPTPAPAPQPSPVPMSSLFPLARRVMVAANTDPRTLASWMKPGWCLAVCCDPNPNPYARWLTRDLILYAKSRGLRTAGWTGRLGPLSGFTGPGARFTVRAIADYGLDYGIGQTENVDEYWDCVEYGLDRVIVGNPNELLSDPRALDHARQRCAAGQQVWLVENYWNDQRANDRPDRYSVPQGIVVASRCIALGSDARVPYKTRDEYMQVMPAGEHVSVYDAGVSKSDVEALP